MKIFILLILVSIIAPEGKGGGIRKQIGFLSGVIACLVLISPLVKALGKEITLPDDQIGQTVVDDHAAERAIIDGGAEIICSELEGAVERIYGISAPKLTLELDTEDIGSIKIISAHLVGTGNIALAGEYISRTLLCPVTVSQTDGRYGGE